MKSVQILKEKTQSNTASNQNAIGTVTKSTNKSKPSGGQAQQSAAAIQIQAAITASKLGNTKKKNSTTIPTQNDLRGSCDIVTTEVNIGMGDGERVEAMDELEDAA